ncbi:MAG: hypothetical protein BRD33_04050 [Bacteroidetes bacterium QH_6_63_17]|nr:MAG: hypothetical protein BRD33_04050 [Bacteroidetes bacterium QH_6_63_17]PSQ79771.1 MAG: hypothetical protein BRD41_06620 [Bacteroidetes bacterium QS_1_63_11]
MPATLSKSEIFRALDDLPDEEIALEDVIECLILLKKVRSGLDQEGEGVPHDDVKQQFKKSPEERTWH